MLKYVLSVPVLNRQSFKFKHILKYLHFLLPSATFCVFDVIFYILMFIHLLIIIAILQFTVFLLLIFILVYVFTMYLPLLVGFFSFLQLLTSCYNLFFSIQRRPFNISFRVGLVLINSFSFCLSEKLFISPSILNDNLTGQSILSCRFFPFSTLTISCNSFLACNISVEESADNLMGEGVPCN